MAAPESKPCPFLVRAATAQDLPSVRAWLPDALGGTPVATLTVAADVASGAVAGVAALRVFNDRVGRFILFVDPRFRRRGCGTALLESIRQAARRAHVTSLLTGRSFEAGADDASRAALAFFRARGLSVAQEIVRHRIELKQGLAVLEPLYRRRVQGPLGSHAACIVPADQVDPHTLADFVVRHVGGLPEVVADRLKGHGLAYCPAASMAARSGNAIVGALLSLAEGDRGFLESKAVAARHRGGWINLALMYHAATAAHRLGIRTVEFENDTREKDTASSALRVGATQVGRRQCWGCPVPECPASLPPAPRVPAEAGVGPSERPTRTVVDVPEQRNIEASLAMARQLRQAGRHADAARCYHALLAREPNHADALHEFGVLHHQCGYSERAIDLIGRAVALRPGTPAYHANLAEAHRAVGQYQEALDCCGAALRLQPNYPEARNNLGLSLHDLGRHAEAAEQFRAALRMRPEFALALNNLGTSLAALGRAEEALEAFRAAVSLDPNQALARSNLGQLLVDRGRAEEALPHCREAVRLQPDLAAAHNNLGNAYGALGRWAEAHSAYDAALRLAPDLARGQAHRGLACPQQGDLACAFA
jgi:tetratricopeptide (TPR) repeat protein/GNAT superfamily N-acetyltransferase